MILRNWEQSRKRLAFTLIELLIVVAIIAILAAIAVPNFMEAQMRAKITRVKSDMRSAATAIESYAVDYNKYPYTPPDVNGGTRGGFETLTNLSTPVAYMTSAVVLDPFNMQRGLDGHNTMRYNVTYINIQFYSRRRTNSDTIPRDIPPWGLFCYGPDREKGPNPLGGGWATSRYGRIPPAPHQNDYFFTLWKYDSTNGTKSNGDIFYWGGAGTL